MLEALIIDVFRALIINNLKSSATIKRQLLSNANNVTSFYTINDEQMYRYLENKTNHTKLALKQDNKARVVVRYLFDSDFAAKYAESLEDDSKYTFTISSKFKDQIEIVKQEFTKYVLDNLNDNKSK